MREVGCLGEWHFLKREGPDKGVYVRVGSTNRRADPELVEELGRYFPDAWIQVGRFRGTDKTDIIDHTEIKTHLVQAVEDAISFVRKHTLHGAEIGAVRRTERWSLPPMPTPSSAEHPSAWRSSTTGWRQLAASSPDTPAQWAASTHCRAARSECGSAPSAGLCRNRLTLSRL